MFDYFNRWSDNPDNSLQLAKHNAEQAVQKDPNEPLARFAASLAAMFGKDLDRAKSEANIALSLNPNFALAYNNLGAICAYSGQPLAAITAIERAMRLDPAWSQQYLHSLGTVSWRSSVDPSGDLHAWRRSWSNAEVLRSICKEARVLMLSRLTKANRLRAAVVMALFYALCSVAPASAFVFGDGSQVAHCLIGNDDDALHASKPHEHSAANTHVHADGTSHVHGKKSDAGKSDEHGKTSDSKCCGLMCIIALPASLASGNCPDLPRITAIATVESYATGQPPVRLYRPPNTPLSH